MVSKRSLVWKYFLQQKAKEILNAGVCFFKLYLWTGWILGLFSLMVVFEDDLSNGFIYTGNWWGLIPGMIWILFMAIFIIMVFCWWISDNWEEANKRADKEVRKIKKGRKKNV